MDKKQLKKILILLLAIFGLSVGIFLIPKRQTLKQKAAFGNVNVRLNPATATKNVNQEFDVLIKIEAGSHKVSGVDLKLNYDKNKLAITGFAHNASAFDNNLTTDLGATSGTARIVVLKAGAGLPTGTFLVGTLKVKGKMVSGGTPFALTINKTDSVIVGETTGDDVVLAIDQTTNGSYTIIAVGVTGTPTPTPTPMPTGPTPTPTPTTGVAAARVNVRAVPNLPEVLGKNNEPFSADIYLNAGSPVKYAKLLMSYSPENLTIVSANFANGLSGTLTKTANLFTLEAVRTDGLAGYFKLATLNMKVNGDKLSGGVTYVKACNFAEPSQSCNINGTGASAGSYILQINNVLADPPALIKVTLTAFGGPSVTAGPTATRGPTATPVPGWTCSGGCSGLEVCRRDCLSGTCLERPSECGWPGYRCCVPAPTSTPMATSTLTPTSTPIPAGPTNTPTPGGPTSTPPPGGWPVLNFKVKFQGVASKRADQKVKVIVKKDALDKTFSEVNVVADDNGIYSGSVTLTDVLAGGGYRIFVKGPKHLARKFCENNQASRCRGSGNLTLASGANTFDFSKIVLEAGDLPNPDDEMKQDGVVNSVDYSLWKARIGKEDSAALAVADVNFDGIVNSIDWQLMRVTLETKYEEEE